MDPLGILVLAGLSLGVLAGAVRAGVALARTRRDRWERAAADLAALDAFLTARPGWCLEMRHEGIDGWYAEVRVPRSLMPAAAGPWYVVANAREPRAEWAIASLVRRLPAT